MARSEAQTAGRWKQRRQDTPARPVAVAAAVGAALLLLVITFVAGHHVGSAPVAGLKRTLSSIQQTNVTLQHRLAQLGAANAGLEKQIWALEHNCTMAQETVQTVQGLIARGENSEAAAVAALTLSQRHVCPRSALGMLWYRSSMTALYQRGPSAPLDDASVVTFEHIRRQAAAWKIPQDSPVNVLSSSYQAGMWTLTLHGAALAIKQHLVTATDTPLLQTVYAAMRNVGHDAIFHGTGRARMIGATDLATARAIARLAGLTTAGEAEADLVAALGAKQAARVQPNWHDPIVVFLAKQARGS